MHELVGYVCRVEWMPTPNHQITCTALMDTNWVTVRAVAMPMIKLQGLYTDQVWVNVNLIKTIVPQRRESTTKGLI